jgi:hypothetical protein
VGGNPARRCPATPPPAEHWRVRGYVDATDVCVAMGTIGRQRAWPVIPREMLLSGGEAFAEPPQ